MHGGKTATAAEKRRMAKLHRTGCRACDVRGTFSCGPIQCHHLKDYNARRGHRFTIALGAYHHEGILPPGYTHKEALEYFGPSVKHGSRPFKDAFGTDDVLLEEQNRLLKELK